MNAYVAGFAGRERQRAKCFFTRIAFDKEAFAVTADVVTGGAGSLILTGVNRHTGGTIVAEGVLQIGGGGTAGNISGYLNDSSQLIFNRSDNIHWGRCMCCLMPPFTALGT